MALLNYRVSKKGALLFYYSGSWKLPGPGFRRTVGGTARCSFKEKEGCWEGTDLLSLARYQLEADKLEAGP